MTRNRPTPHRDHEEEGGAVHVGSHARHLVDQNLDVGFGDGDGKADGEGGDEDQRQVAPVGQGRAHALAERYHADVGADQEDAQSEEKQNAAHDKLGQLSRGQGAIVKLRRTTMAMTGITDTADSLSL
ncbi:MAG: hypothetical protein LUE17_04275 [Planctomycetaceae bacterium]|nr:hypothetical protein [Planctomycetaceae bacterium]